MQPNGSAHVGQPVPTYSTVLLAVAPQVVTVSVPPTGMVAPRKMAYTSREPGKKARNPVGQVPDVYMPGVPSRAVESAGAEPLVPDRSRTFDKPRQNGSVGEADGVRVREEALDGLPVELHVPVWLGGGVDIELGELVAARLPDPVALTDLVPVALVVVVPLELRVGVPVALDEPVPVALGDDVPVWLPVALDDGVPVSLSVALDDGVPVWLPDALDDDVPVPLDVTLRVGVELDDGVPVALDVTLRLAVTLDDGVPVALDVTLQLAVTLDDCVCVALEDTLRLAVADRVWEPLPVAV